MTHKTRTRSTVGIEWDDWLVSLPITSKIHHSANAGMIADVRAILLESTLCLPLPSLPLHVESLLLNTFHILRWIHILTLIHRESFCMPALYFSPGLYDRNWSTLFVVTLFLFSWGLFYR